MLTLLYLISLSVGVYEIFWASNTNPYVIGITLAASWLCGMQWGEFIEKIQHLHHLWNSPLGSGHEKN